jgi:hypothetical protein
MNAIRARDGTAYHRDDGMPYLTQETWNDLTEEISDAIEAISGEPPKPWPFVWELNEADSAAFVAALLNAPEPNAAIKAAATRYKAVLASLKEDPDAA